MPNIMNTCYNGVILLNFYFFVFCKCFRVYLDFLGFVYNLHYRCLLKCLNEFFVFNFLLCRYETMADMFDVHAQFNGGEPQSLKVWCLGVTLRGLKD